MKKIHLIIALCVLSLTAVAQQRYAIYEWQGKALIKVNKGQYWHPVQKGQSVILTDSISIDKNGSLRVVDNQTNMIYKSTSSGKMRVSDLINAAKNQNSNIISAVNREILNSAKNSSNAHSMQLVGATFRGSNDEALVDSIVQTFGWLANRAIQGELTASGSDLSLVRRETSDGVWFELQNESETSYYVNVLHIKKQTKKVNLCYIIEQTQEPEYPFLYLPQGERMELSDLLFTMDPANDIYILIGTEDQYIPEQVQSLLRYLDVETAKLLYGKYTFFMP